MDPLAALKQLLRGLLDQDADVAYEHADALSGWLEKDGAIPNKADIRQALAEVLDETA